MSKVPKWKIVENVVAALESSLNKVDGARVVRNAKILQNGSKVRRQVDVFVEIPTGPRKVRVGIEVKYQNRPLDISETEELVAKLKKLQIDYRCIVTKSGLTAEAAEEAKNNGVQALTVKEIERPDFWLAQTVDVLSRQIELKKIVVNFNENDSEKARKALDGTDIRKLNLLLLDGITINIGEFAKKHGVAELNKNPELANVKDQHQLRLTMENKEKVGFDRKDIPIPDSLTGLYIIHVKLEKLPALFFKREDGSMVATAISKELKKQLTITMVEQPDGSKKMMFSASDPTPKPTDIEDRDGQEEPTR